MAYINVSLPPELATKIRKVACVENKSLSQWFREAADVYLAEDEERTDPAMVHKAHQQMTAIFSYATKVQAIMENVKKYGSET